MVDYDAVYCPWCLTVMDVEHDNAFIPIYAECPACRYEIHDEPLTLGRILDGRGDDQEYHCVNLTKWTRFVREVAKDDDHDV